MLLFFPSLVSCELENIFVVSSLLASYLEKLWGLQFFKWVVLLQNAINTIRKSLRMQQKRNHKMSRQWTYFDEWWIYFFFRIKWTQISLNFVSPSLRGSFEVSIMQMALVAFCSTGGKCYEIDHSFTPFGEQTTVWENIASVPLTLRFCLVSVLIFLEADNMSQSWHELSCLELESKKRTTNFSFEGLNTHLK